MTRWADQYLKTHPPYPLGEPVLKKNETPQARWDQYLKKNETFPEGAVSEAVSKHFKLAGRCVFLKGNNDIRKGCLGGRS